MKKMYASLILLITSLGLPVAPVCAETQGEAFKVGWIGGMTGPTAKYGTYQSAQLAEELINKAGGINGRPLKLIYEDGKANSVASVNAAMKLIKQDKVSFIVGGHCTPESLPVSSIAERNRVLMLAAVTSSPKLTPAGDYIFRVTAVSTTGVDLLFPEALKRSSGKKFAVIYEETDYAEPLAHRFRDLVEKAGAQIALYDGYMPGETDFRPLLLKARSAQADSLYLSIQAPEVPALLFRQMNELGIKLKVYGNEITGNAVSPDKDMTALFEGMAFAEPEFDLQSPETSRFVAEFSKKFKVDKLPYGIWSAEAFDAVTLLAKTIARCGETAEAVKACLYQVHDYPGASGSISIDSNGDGIRKYALKEVHNGEIRRLSK